MKNCFCLASVCLLILFAGASSFAQNVSVLATPQGEAQRPITQQQGCPTVSVSCPSGIDVGKPLVIQASLFGWDSKGTLKYDWEVSGGLIAEGQGTPAIKVNWVGRRSDSVTATLRVGGLDRTCANTASCSIMGHRPWPRAEKVDSYGAVPFNKGKAKLDLLAAILRQNPGTKGYIVGYGGRRSRAGEAQKAVDRAKGYLSNEMGINEYRIVTVDGGFKKQSQVDLWLVPSGAYPPAASPTVDPAAAKMIKSTANKRARRPIEH